MKEATFLENGSLEKLATEKQNAPGLSTIIVNWNGMGLLKDCLNSIDENPPSVPYDIILVDNNSTDGSVEWPRYEKKKRGQKLNLMGKIATSSIVFKESIRLLVQ